MDFQEKITIRLLIKISKSGTFVNLLGEGKQCWPWFVLVDHNFLKIKICSYCHWRVTELIICNKNVFREKKPVGWGLGLGSVIWCLMPVNLRRLVTWSLGCRPTPLQTISAVDSSGIPVCTKPLKVNFKFFDSIISHYK